jgi:hypothetical protein
MPTLIADEFASPVLDFKVGVEIINSPWEFLNL